MDTLTGEWRLLRADLLHDVGRSLNPAIDIGQVEGAFIQGMGWLTMEELVWHPQRAADDHAPSTYKIPTANDCPADFRVRLFGNDNAEGQHPPQQGGGRAAAAAAVSVFFADPRCDLGGRRAPRRSALSVRPPAGDPARSRR